MTVAQAAKEYAMGLAPVIALVQGRGWTFKFPPNPTLPAVLFRQVGDIHTSHLRGAANKKWARVQVDCIAKNIKDAQAVDQAIKGTYEGGVPTGLLGADATVGGSPGIRMQVNAESLDYREEYEGDELKQARTSRDYKVWIDSI